VGANIVSAAAPKPGAARTGHAHKKNIANHFIFVNPFLCLLATAGFFQACANIKW
jgi:hypothetical protein